MGDVLLLVFINLDKKEYIMRLTELNRLIDQLNESDKVAIIALIDAKTEADMREVMQKLDSMGEALKAQIAGVEAKMDARFASVDSRMNGIESRLSFLQWSMGIGFTVIATVIAVLKLWA